MTTITTASTLSDVLSALNSGSRSIATTDWSAITTPTAASSVWSAKVGLFSDDMTAFWDNCAIIGYNECSPAEFAAYSGWAIGLEVTLLSALGGTD